MSSTAFIYLLVKICEILVVITCGIAISKLPTKISTSKYWKIAVWAILAYAIGEGLRWGHMVDYNSGCITYNGIQGFLDDERNPLWSIIIYTFKLIGINYNLFIFFQCAFVMFSIMVLVKNYHKYAAYILPLTIIGILMNENFFRWFTAFGFVLIGIHYYINNKNVRAVVFFGLSVLTHFGYLFVIWLFLLFKPLNRLEIKPWTACSIFVVVVLFGDISWIAEPMNNLSLLMIKEGFTEDVNEGFVYLSNTDKLFSGDLSKGIVETSITAKLVRLIINVPVLLWSKKYIKDVIPHYNSYYNLYALGLIIGQLFMMVTLLGRISDIMVFFFCIVGGTFYYMAIKGKMRASLFYIIGIILYFTPYIMAPFSREDRDMYFLWDSNGMEYNKSYM